MKIHKKMLTDIIDESVIKYKPINENISDWLDVVYKYSEENGFKVEQVVYVPLGISGNYLIIFSS